MDLAKDAELSPEELPRLVSVLDCIKYKWEDIAIGLNLPVDDIELIKASGNPRCI